MIADTQVLARLSKIISPGEIPSVVNRLMRTPLTWEYLHRPAVLAATNLVSPANLQPSRLAFHAISMPIADLETEAAWQNEEADWAGILSEKLCPQTIEEAARCALHILRVARTDSWEAKTAAVVLSSPDTWREPLAIAWPHLPAGNHLLEELASSGNPAGVQLIADALLANESLNDAADRISRLPTNVLPDILIQLQNRQEHALLAAVMDHISDVEESEPGIPAQKSISSLTLHHTAKELLSLNYSTQDPGLEDYFNRLTSFQARIADELANQAAASGQFEIEINRRRQALAAEPTPLRRALVAKALNSNGLFQQALDTLPDACESVEECVAAGKAFLALEQRDHANVMLTQAAENLKDLRGDLSVWTSELVASLEIMGNRRLSLTAAHRYTHMLPGSPYAHVLFAEQLFSAGDADNAAEAAQIGLALDPDNLAARKVLARSLQATRKFSQALPHWEAVTAEDPSENMNLVSCAMEAGSLETAREAIATSTSANEGDFRTAALRCRVLHASGETEEALGSIHPLLEKYPHAVELWLALFEILKQTAPDDEIETALTRANQSAVDAPRLLNSYAEWLHHVGRTSEALGFAERSFRVDQNSAETATLYASLLQKMADPKAVVLYRKAHELQPRNWSVLLSLAELVEERESTSAAAELLRDIPILLNPNHNLVAGKILLQAAQDEQELEKAVLHLEKAVEGDNRPPQASFWLAQALSSSGRLHEAIQKFQSFLFMDENGMCCPLRKQAFLQLAETARAVDNTILGLTTLENARDTLPGDVDILLPLAQAYLEAGLFQQCMATSLQALEKDKNCSEARSLLLKASINSGSFDEAEGYLQEMMHSQPTSSATWLGAAALRNAQGRIPELRNSVGTALSFGRREVRTLIEASRILLAAGLNLSAARILRYGINTLEVDRHLLRELAEASEDTSDYQSAQKAWRRYSVQAPEDPQGFLRAVKALWKLDRHAAAFELLNQAVSRFEDDATFPMLQAEYHLAEGQWVDARQSLRKALEKSPNDPATLIRSASALIRMSEYGDAETLLNHALKVAPNSMEARHLLGETLVEQSRFADAHKILTKTEEISGEVNPQPAWWFAVSAYAAARNKDYETAHRAFSQAHIRPIESDKDVIWLSRAARSLGYRDISLRVFSNQANDFSGSDPALRLALMEAWIEATEADAVLRKYCSVQQHAVLQTSFDSVSLPEMVENGNVSEASEDLIGLRIRLAKLDLNRDLMETVEALLERTQSSELLTSLAVAQLRQNNASKALETLHLVHRAGQLDDWHHILITTALIEHKQTELARKTIAGFKANPSLQPVLDYLAGKSWQLENNYKEFCQAVSRAGAVWMDEPVWQFELGQAYDLLNDSASAIPHLQQAVLLDKANPAAAHLLAQVLEKDGQLAEAAEIYEQALRNNPTDGDLLVEAGRLALELDQPQKADRWFERAGTLGADSEAYHLGRAKTFSALGHFDSAAASAEVILEMDPQNTRALLLLGEINRLNGRPDLALQALERAAALLPESNILAMERAKLQIETGKADDALLIIQQLLKDNPEDERLWALASNAHQASGNTEDALEAMSNAVRLAPRTHTYRISLGTLALELGQLDRALAELEKASELNPDSSLIHLLRGEIYEARKQQSQALDAYQKAISLDPDHAEPHFKAGMILKQMKAYPEAGLMLKQAASLNPQDPDIMHQLAAVRALELVHGQILQSAVES